MGKFTVFFLGIIFISLPAWADDAVEAAATGNIEFEKTPYLIMQDETLTITKTTGTHFGEDKFSIDVDFRFKNISANEIIRKIAFALPPVQCRMDFNSMWAGLDSKFTSSEGNAGLTDFTTTVDGKPQAMTIRTVAMLGNKNITDLLNTLHIPLNPCNIESTLDGQPDPKYRTNLEKYHLITEYNEAAWTENIYYEWVQRFPAGQVINIHHHYTPVIGAAVLSGRTVKELNDWFSDNTPSFSALWNKKITSLAKLNPALVYQDTETKDNQLRYCVMPEWIRYKLTTGAYWNGGIGTFKLIINNDNQIPFAVNKFYTQANNTQSIIIDNSMTFIIKDFVPMRDLLILFLAVPQTKNDIQLCGH